MDQQRIHAYEKLTEQLLVCSSEEEERAILQSNTELLDYGLTNVMMTYASDRRRNGQPGVADSLLELAVRISKVFR